MAPDVIETQINGERGNTEMAINVIGRAEAQRQSGLIRRVKDTFGPLFDLYIHGPKHIEYFVSDFRSELPAIERGKVDAAFQGVM